MPEQYALDSSVLIPLLEKGNSEMRETFRGFLRHVRHTRSRIVVPAPVLTEYLKGPPRGAEAWDPQLARLRLSTLLHGAPILPVNEMVALRAAVVARTDAGRAKLDQMYKAAKSDFGRRVVQQFVVIDWLITATAAAHGVSVIYTNTGEAVRWRRWSADAFPGLRVAPWTEMPQRVEHHLATTSAVFGLQGSLFEEQSD